MSKYIKGEPITCVDELMKQEFIYFYDRLVPFGWFQDWQIGWARLVCKSNLVFEAINLENLGNGIFHEFLTLEEKYQKPLLEWLNSKYK